MSPACIYQSNHLISCQLLDPGDPTHAHLKVGRATSLNKRIDEWSKQCSSKEQVLRGWWPEGLKDGISLLKGTVDPGEKGRYCHRLERLIHLELADIAQNAPYLDPKFPDVVVEDKAIARSTASCPDCEYS